MDSDGKLASNVHSLLWNGMAAASAAIAFGAVLGAASTEGSSISLLGWQIAGVGIGIILAIPFARVALMLLHFARLRDWDYALMGAFILAVSLAGLVLFS